MNGKQPAGTVRRIVVATDFSSASRNALDAAVALARAQGARLQIVHVVAPPVVVPDLVVLDLKTYRAFREGAVARLARWVSRARRMGIDATGRMEDGGAADGILSAVRRARADLLVIGTRGLTGFRHLLLGSVAEKLLRGCPVPVLAVHPKDRLSAKGVRTVLVPTDFSHDASPTVRAALRLLPDLKRSRVVLLHVTHLSYDYALFGDLTPAQFFADARKRAMARLARLAKPLRKRVRRVDLEVRDGFPVEVILAQARAAGADLIAMSTHGRSGLSRLLLGSTAERAIQHASCPVLAVKRT